MIASGGGPYSVSRMPLRIVHPTAASPCPWRVRGYWDTNGSLK